MYIKTVQQVWKLYLLAIALIAVCITGFFLLSDINAKQQEENSTAINIAGRQRMLSQRIALFSNVYLNSVRERNDISAAKAEEHLRQAHDLFMTSHSGLISGDQDLNLTGKTGKVAYDIYYNAPDLLDEKVRSFSRVIERLLQEDDIATLHTYVLQINAYSTDELLAPLDKVVNRLEINSLEELQYLRRLEVISFLIAISILILELIFIFWPTYRFIYKRIHDSRDEKNDLDFLSRAFDASPDLIYVKDANFRYIRINQKLSELYAPESRTDLIGSTAIDLHAEDEAETFIALDRKALVDGEVTSTDALTAHDGTKKTFAMKHVKMTGPDGENYVLCVGRET